MEYINIMSLTSFVFWPLLKRKPLIYKLLSSSMENITAQLTAPSGVKIRKLV